MAPSSTSFPRESGEPTRAGDLTSLVGSSQFVVCRSATGLLAIYYQLNYSCATVLELHQLRRLLTVFNCLYCMS